MTFPRSAYHDPFPSGFSPNGAAGRGWGQGWPHCQGSAMKTIVAKDQSKGGGHDIRVSVRHEVAQMVAYLLEATDKIYNVNQSDTGGYNCRPIAGTSTPSNHSWGLAIDINWNENPRTAPLHSVIPPVVVAMWNDCGWFWGGFYAHSTPDAMHFEYVGKPSEVAGHTARALEHLGGTAPVPTPVPVPGGTYVVTLGKNVKPGLADPTTVDLQRALIATGYAAGIFTSPNTTGLYGKGTEAAVRKYFDAHPEFQSSATDTAIGAKGWAFLRALALKVGK